MTQTSMLVYGLVYLGVSLIFGTLTVFLFFKLFNVLTRKIDDMQEIKQNNVAVAILNAAVVFAVALFISEAIESAMEAFKNNIVVFGSQLSSGQKVKTYFIMLAHFVIAVLISFLVLWLSIRIFVGLTRSIDEFDEIKKNNQSVAIIMAVVILAMSIIIKPGIGKLLKGFISYPIPQARSGLVPRNPLQNQNTNTRRGNQQGNTGSQNQSNN